MEKKEWRPMRNSELTEFNSANQILADLNRLSSRHKKAFGKNLESNPSEGFVTREILGEKCSVYEYRCTLITSISFMRGRFTGKSLHSPEEAMKNAIQLAIKQFPKPRKEQRKLRANGVVRRLGRMKIKKVFKYVFR